MTKPLRQKGFSILEMMLYIVILSFMLAIIINILVVMNKSVRQLHALKSVETSGTFAMERIVRESRNASSIITASSTLDASPGVLVLSDGSTSPRVVQFSLQNGQLRMKENGIDLGALTQGDASVTSLVFTKITTTHSTAVKAQMTIESGTSTFYRSGKFYSTVIFRESL
jgi:Tfp pilus assembly protein PilW